MGEFGTGGAGRILDTVGTLAGLFRGKIDKNVKRALDGLRMVMTIGFAALADFMTETGQKTAKGVGLLRSLWDGVLLPVLSKLDGWVKRSHDWLTKVVGPILRTLLKYRKKLLDFYAHWFRPIFDTIDAVRGLLRVLGFLHLDVARKLDEKLGRIESWVLHLLEVPLAKINELVDFSERVMDLNGFFQRYTLIRSLLLHERDVLKVWWHTIHTREIETKRPPGVFAPARTADDRAQSIGAYIDGGDDPGRARVDERAKDIEIYWRTSAPLLP